MAKKKFENTILNDWKKEADNFHSKVDAALSEVHQCKKQIAGMKAEILNEIINNGQYFRDDECIVLSAPKIILGNVEKNGDLKGASKIIIRGTSVDLDGVGDGGTIKMRAPSINQKAVDPGIDGNEEVVYTSSSITSQARTIIIDSKAPIDNANKKGTFLPAEGSDGITITSEKEITVAAS